MSSARLSARLVAAAIRKDGRVRLGLLVLSSVASAADCRLGETKRVLRRERGGYTAVWELPDGPARSAPAQPPPDYESWVRSRTGLDARQGLWNHVAAVEEGLARMSPDDRGRAEIARSAEVGKRVAAGQAGTLRALNCLERLLFEAFFAVRDLRKHPDEFLALLLRKDGAVAALADLYPDPSGVSGVGMSEALRAELERRRAAGWTLEAHLHNHPFRFARGYRDFGGNLAPSGPDLESYRALAPERALITNGLETVELDAPDIGALER